MGRSDMVYRLHSNGVIERQASDARRGEKTTDKKKSE